jgi:D-arabinono-1,4-lactone oxidase
MNIGHLDIQGVPYYLPANEQEVMYLVDKAIAEKKVICMRGAAHSIPLIKSLEHEKNRIYVYLGRMRAATIDASNQMVTVQGGCNIGLDPNDPTGISTLENSLVYQVHQAGFAFPDLGGITHQTVGGFLSTGAAGSSLKSPFNECLHSITFITAQNGKATRVTFTRDTQYDTNEFFAAGLSLGLFGVLVEASFHLTNYYIVRGQEVTLSLQDWNVDFFGDDPSKKQLTTFFEEHDFQRLLWWPQKKLNKIQVWTAQKDSMPNKFSPLPYEQLTGTLLGIPYQQLGKWLLSFFGWMSWAIQRKSFFRKTWLGEWIAGIFRNSLVPWSLGLLIENGVIRFKDTWYDGIPMDTCIDERLIPVWLSELWFPLDKGPQVIAEFRDYFERRHDGPGTFSYEIYPAKATEFWLSPGYMRNSLRIDIFWFAGNPEDPIKDFYQAFWNQLDEYEFRSHWGKFMPDQSKEDLIHLYPKYEQWKKLRIKYDPVGVFLSDYWRTRLWLP